MIKRDALKRFISVFTAVTYLQVNVAWCGVPTLPLAQHIRSTVEALPDVAQEKGPVAAALWAVGQLLSSGKVETVIRGRRDVFVFNRRREEEEFRPPRAEGGRGGRDREMGGRDGTR